MQTVEAFEVNTDTLFARIEDPVTAPLGEHLMMLSMSHGTYFDLNPTARLIWETLKTPQTFAHLCMILQQEYEVSAEQCEQAVRCFLSQLYAEKMIALQVHA